MSTAAQESKDVNMADASGAVSDEYVAQRLCVCGMERVVCRAVTIEAGRLQVTFGQSSLRFARTSTMVACRY